MGSEPLPALPPIQTASEYEAAVARFWALVDRPDDLPLLLAMREVMRTYELAQRQPAAGYRRVARQP